MSSPLKQRSILKPPVKVDFSLSETKRPWKVLSRGMTYDLSHQKSSYGYDARKTIGAVGEQQPKWTTA